MRMLVISLRKPIRFAKARRRMTAATLSLMDLCEGGADGPPNAADRTRVGAPRIVVTGKFLTA
jgi:hypothetical protein